MFFGTASANGTTNGRATTAESAPTSTSGRPQEPTPVQLSSDDSADPAELDESSSCDTSRPTDDCNAPTTEEDHSPLALFMAHRWRARWMAWLYGSWLCEFTRDDLRQAGEVRLWEEAEKYHPGLPWSFSTYAWNGIRWAILQERRKLWRHRRRQRPFTQFDDGASAENLIPLECQTPDERVADTEEIQMIRQRVADRVKVTGTTRHFALKCLLRDATVERDPIPVNPKRMAFA